MNGLGPWSDKLEMLAPESSETFSSHARIRLERKSSSAFLSYSGTGFVGIFRASEQSVDIVHPAKSVFYSKEEGLPLGQNFEGHVSVKPNDIILVILPSKPSWSGINAVDLPFAMFGANAAGGSGSLDGLLRNLPKIMKDPTCSILISVVSDKPKSVCGPYKIMDSHLYKLSLEATPDEPENKKAAIEDHKVSLSPKKSLRTSTGSSSSLICSSAATEPASARDESWEVDKDEWKNYIPGGINYDHRFKTPTSNWEIGQSYGGY